MARLIFGNRKLGSWTQSFDPNSKIYVTLTGLVLPFESITSQEQLLSNFT